MLIAHNARKSNRQAINRTQAQSDHIMNAFENFERHCGCVAVQPLTAISPYSTIHEDICRFAEDKRAAFIIIPFHKQQTVDGGMEATNPSFRTINQNLLANAPCSVGILVDRGLTGSTRLGTGHPTHHVAVLFFGGPDDREALAYGWRMSDHPGVRLSVIRFLSSENFYSESSSLSPPSSSANNAVEPGMLTVVTDIDREKQLDEDYLNEFRTKLASEDSVGYTERVVHNGEETVSSIRTMDTVHDLFIVGRGQGMISPLTAGLTEWSECPELGAIGDILASSDFASSVSVLVVQQYIGMEVHGDHGGGNTPDSPSDHHRDYFASNNRWNPPPHKEQTIFHSQP